MASRIHQGRRGYIAKNVSTLTNVTYTSTTSVAAVLLTAEDFNIRDASINNWTVTKNGVTTSTTQTINTNCSMYFDGSGTDYMTIPTANNATVAIGTGDYTWDAWIWPDSTLSSGTIMGNLQFGSTTNFWWTFNSTSLAITVYNGTSGWSPSMPGAVTGNAWNHVAVTRQGTLNRIWINGVKVAEQTNSTNIGNSLNISFGSDHNGETTSFKGYMSQVRVVKGAALYQGNFTPPGSLTTSSLAIVSSTSTNVFGAYLSV